MGERCGCSFSTLPGKELVCAEATRHQGPHHADGVTWTQLSPKRSEEVPDGRRLGLEGRAPATTAAPCTCALQERDQLSRDASDARRQLGITRATVVRLDDENQALRDKVADLEVYAAEQHEALEAIAAHFAVEPAFPGSPLGKVRDALAVQPPQHRQQLLGYQTSDGRLYQPEDITLVYALDQGETALDGDR